MLSFPRYCRYRGILKRLEGVHNKWLRTALVVALGGFTVPCRNTRVLYCKDTFDYPDLEGHELLCNHLGEYILWLQKIIKTVTAFCLCFFSPYLKNSVIF